jgi:type II secretory pathway component PulL
MYTRPRLRYATRWNRRLLFAFVILLLLFVSWRSYQAWQQSRQPVRMAPSRLV